MKRRRFGLLVLVPVLVLAACDSPEAMRTRGGGAGGDVGNRGQPVRLHEGSQPYHATPQLVPVAAPGASAAASR